MQLLRLEDETSWYSACFRAIVSLCVVLLLCGSCSDNAGTQYIEFVMQIDGTVLWDEYELQRKDYIGSTYLVDQQDTALRVGEHILRVFFLNDDFDDLSHRTEYGTVEIIQVCLDGDWYDLPLLLPKREEPLVLPMLSDNSQTRGYLLEQLAYSEHEVDLSAFGVLPPGEYRLVEGFYNSLRNIVENRFAYFWVIAADSPIPHESEIIGQPRAEDFSFGTVSPVLARKEVTDIDSSFSIVVNNQSGRIYDTSGRLELESLLDGKWGGIRCQNSGGGLLLRWSGSFYRFVLDEPLQPGKYRVLLRAEVFGKQSEAIVADYEFFVISHAAVSEPKWDAKALMLSMLDESKLSSSVIMTVQNPVLDSMNSELDVTISAVDYYGYDYAFDLEVRIDGRWYLVGRPFSMIAAENDEGYDGTVGPDMVRHQVLNPSQYVGTLPTGEYRLVREFNLYDHGVAATSGGAAQVLAREYAAVEFSVE